MSCALEVPGRTKMKLGISESGNSRRASGIFALQ